jgi:hypothetical protein
MPNCKRCGLAFGAGIGICAGCVFAGEVFEFKLLNSIQCYSPPVYLDFGHLRAAITNHYRIIGWAG